MTNANDSVYPEMNQLKDTNEGAVVLCNAIPLTKREYFTAMALQGILACSTVEATYEQIVEASVKTADLLIKELNKKK